MVEFPPGEPQEICAICREPFEDFNPDFASGYANLVCHACEERAVTEQGNPAEVSSAPNGDAVGANPVYIDRSKCWRRFFMGGYVTRKDEFGCESIREFHEKHRDDF